MSLIVFGLQIFAAIIHIYPFEDRLSLFLLPCLILIVSSLTESEMNPTSVIKSCLLLYFIALTINIPLLLNFTLGKNFSTIDPIFLRENKKAETIAFLDQYKNADLFICFDDFFLQVQYYNELYKYNHPLNYFDAFYDSRNTLDGVVNGIETHPNDNIWIFGITNSWITDNMEVNDEDLENIFKTTNRKYLIYPTKNGNMYYLPKPE